MNDGASLGHISPTTALAGLEGNLKGSAPSFFLFNLFTTQKTLVFRPHDFYW